MFARASCEDGDRSVYFASVRFESASTPLYHEFPFLLPVTVFHPLPIRPPILSSTTMLHRRGTISRTWSEITFLPPWWPLSNELSRRPTISKETISKEIRRSLEGSRRETLRSFKGANLFEYLEETVEIIPCFSRIRVQSPRSIQGRSIDFLPESLQDPRRQQEWRGAQPRFAIRTSNVGGGRGTIDRSTFLSNRQRANERDSGWSMKRSIRLDSSRLHDHDEAHRHA